VSLAVSPAHGQSVRAGATVIVADKGWTSLRSELLYGLRLKNTSPTLDAVGVEVSFAATRASSTNPFGPDTFTIHVIPANGSFNLGGAAYADAGRLASPVISIHVESWRAVGYVLPKVIDVRRNPIGAFEATLVNPYSKPLDALSTTVSVVYLDGHGRIVGGDRPGVPFYPAQLIGARKRIRFAFITPGQIVNKVRTAAISVDPVIARQ
jgi:hypothetical protein